MVAMTMKTPAISLVVEALIAVDHRTAEERAADVAAERSIHGGTWWIRAQEQAGLMTTRDAMRALIVARTARRLQQARERQQQGDRRGP